MLIVRSVPLRFPLQLARLSCLHWLITLLHRFLALPSTTHKVYIWMVIILLYEKKLCYMDPWDLAIYHHQAIKLYLSTPT